MNTLRLVSLLNFVERAPFVLGAWVSYYYMSSSLRVLPPFKRVMIRIYISRTALPPALSLLLVFTKPPSPKLCMTSSNARLFCVAAAYAAGDGLDHDTI